VAPFQLGIAFVAVCASIATLIAVLVTSSPAHIGA
jgi:hypothetical protein